MFFNQNRQAKKNEMASTLLDGSSGCASVFDFSIFYINMDSSEDHTGLSHISLWWRELDRHRRHPNVGITKRSFGFLKKIKPRNFINAANVNISVLLSLIQQQEEEKHVKWDYEVHISGRADLFIGCNKTTLRAHSCTRKFSYLRIFWI